MGAISSVIDTVADVGQSAVDVVSDVGSSVDDLVNDAIPGGWATVASVAVPGAGPAIAAANTLAQGGDIEDAIKSAATSAVIGSVVSQSGLPSAIAESTGSEAAAQFGGNVAGGLLSGQDLESAVQNAAISTGVSQAAGQITGQTPQDFENDVDEVLNSVAGQPVSGFESDINQSLNAPATNPSIGNAVIGLQKPTLQDVLNSIKITTNKLPYDEKYDINGDGKVNVFDTIGLQKAYLGKDPGFDFAENTFVNPFQSKELVSGQDLAADAIPRNTIDNIVNVLPPITEIQITQNVEPISGQDLSADIGTGNTLQDIVNVINQDTIVSGQDLASDIGTGTANTLDDISIALAAEGSDISGQDLAADATPGNTIDDVVDVLPPTPPSEPGLTKAQVEALIKTALAATAADQVINQPEPQKTGFDLVPVPTDWKSPVYDQSFTPIDLDSIFQNLQGAQWKPRPSITGGAFMGSPVNISDIVNQIMSSQLTPNTMPSQITNAVGGILGPSTTR